MRFPVIKTRNWWLGWGIEQKKSFEKVLFPMFFSPVFDNLEFLVPKQKSNGFSDDNDDDHDDTDSSSESDQVRVKKFFTSSFLLSQ